MPDRRWLPLTPLLACALAAAPARAAGDAGTPTDDVEEEVARIMRGSRSWTPADYAEAMERLEALGPAAGPALAAIADGQEGVQQLFHVCHAIERVPSAEAIEALEDKLGHVDWLVRSSCGAAYAASLAHVEAPEEQLDVVMQMMQQDRDCSVRKAVASGIAAHPSERVHAYFEARLFAGDPCERAVAIHGLASDPGADEAVGDAFLQIVLDRRTADELREVAVWGLTRVPFAPARPTLVEIAGAEAAPGNLRSLAIEALGAVGTAEDLPLLHAIVDGDEYGGESIWAVKAKGAIAAIEARGAAGLDDAVAAAVAPDPDAWDGAAHAAGGPRAARDLLRAGRDTPLLIAHRGVPARAPENTLASFRAAVEDGARMIELDVALSADGEVVVIHDDTVDRTTDGAGPVADLSWDRLASLDAGSWFDATFAGEPIPRLARVFDEVGRYVAINVEIKPEAFSDVGVGGIESKVVHLVRQWGLVDRVVVSSFEPRVLPRIKQLEPALMTALLVGGAVRGDPVALLERWHADGLNARADHVTPRLVERLHAAGRPLGVYTVDQPSALRRLERLGVDAVFTNDVAAARAALGDGDPGDEPAP